MLTAENLAQHIRLDASILNDCLYMLGTYPQIPTLSTCVATVTYIVHKLEFIISIRFRFLKRKSIFILLTNSSYQKFRAKRAAVNKLLRIASATQGLEHAANAPEVIAATLYSVLPQSNNLLTFPLRISFKDCLTAFCNCFGSIERLSGRATI